MSAFTLEQAKKERANAEAASSDSYSNTARAVLNDRTRAARAKFN